MRPAFSSTTSAAAFALALLFLMLLPVLIKKAWLPPREQSYAIQGWDNGPYPWLRQQIFEETNDIDIAFVGSSLMMWGIDTPYVQEKLSAELGRPAVVRSLCWGGTGYDALYLIGQDLLKHRKVRLLVFYDEDNKINERNPLSCIWFRYGDNAEALAGLAVKEKGLLYFAAIIGMPRNLLNLLRPNLPLELYSTKPNYMEVQYQTPNPATRLGSVSAEMGCTPSGEGATFTWFQPRTAASPADVCLYSPTNPAGFQFLNKPLPEWQIHFAKKFADLAGTSGCELVMLKIPLLDTARSSVIRERAVWPDVLQHQVKMVGIPPARLFAGLSEEELYRLYANAGHINASHMNRNGQEYFTRLITPALLKIYETSTDH